MKLVDLLLPYQKEVVCSNSRFKVLNWGRQQGKDFTMSFMAVQKACSKNNALVVYLSTGQRAADEALKKCVKFADAVKVLSNGSISYTSSATCLTFSNGSRILSLPGNASSARGWTVDLLLLSEVAFWERADETWQAIVPTLLNELAGGDKNLVVASTPYAKNSLFYKLVQKAKNGEAGWEYFETTIHQAIQQGLKADLDKLHELIPDPKQFACEFECQFLDGQGQLLDTNLLQATDEVPQNLEYFIGADWGRHHDASAIVVVGRDKLNKLYLVDLQQMHNMPYDEQIGIATRTYKKYLPKLMYGDAGGLGNPLMEQLNQKVSAHIKPFTFTSANKTACYEYFRKNVFERNLLILRDFMAPLVADVQLVMQNVSEDGKTTYSAMRTNNSHADVCSALVLALEAERQCKPSFQMPITYARRSSF